MEEHKRIVLKISGESLTESGYMGLKRGPVDAVIEQVKQVYPLFQVAIVLGGGNICRGSRLMRDLQLDKSFRVDADWAGMMATHINGIMLNGLMREAGIDTRLMLAKPYGDVGEPFYKDVAISHLNKKRVIILVGGTGSPRFTTDSAGVLRACEIGASLMLKGTKVDGIYDMDPNAPENRGRASHIPRITYNRFLARELRILDAAAVALARDNALPIRVFNVFRPNSLLDTVTGRQLYSEIGPQE